MSNSKSYDLVISSSLDYAPTQKSCWTF